MMNMLEKTQNVKNETEMILDKFKYDHLSGAITIKKSKYNKCISRSVGFLRPDGYVHISFNNKTYLLHRIAWLLFYKKWPKHYIDHINGKRSDNRICNLRDVKKRQNGQNLEIHRQGRLVGCHFRKDRNKWQAKIKIKGKSIHLGTFNTEIEANSAYEKAIKNLIEK